MLHRFRTTLVASLALTVLAVVGLIAQAPPSQKAADGLTESRLVAAMHSISSHDIWAYLQELVQPKYKGRLTSTAEYDAAATWLADSLAGWGVKPGAGNGTFFQTFKNPYTIIKPGGGLTLHLPVAGGGVVKKPYVFEQDYVQGATSDSGTVTAEVVYAGYGTTAPELGYDDYAGIDVKGKIVLVDPEGPVSPGGSDPEVFKKWRPYTFHDSKMKNAVAHGAAGMIYNYDIYNPNAVWVKGFLLTYVAPSVVADLFQGTGKTHAEQIKLIRSTRKPASLPLGKTVTQTCVTEHHPEGIGRNVIGLIEGSDPALKHEYIIISGHLDFLGMNPEMMQGANDNASAVAVTMAVARAIKSLGVPLKRSVLIINFGAEEQGVKGSEYYVANPVVPHQQVKGVFNMDGVGAGETISGGAGKNYPQLWEVIERNNSKYVHRTISAGANANLGRPRLDAAHFMWANVPTLSFSTGGGRPVPYKTYHKTTDTLALLNPEIMEDISRLLFLSIVDMAQR